MIGPRCQLPTRRAEGALNISSAANKAPFVPTLVHHLSLLRLDRDAMATTPGSLDGDESLFDSACPFKGVVVCCTSVPTELRVCALVSLFELIAAGRLGV